MINAIKAKEFYRRDVQYIVRDGKALIINEVILSRLLYAFNIFQLLCTYESKDLQQNMTQEHTKFDLLYHRTQRRYTMSNMSFCWVCRLSMQG